MSTRPKAVQHLSRWHTDADAARFRALGWWSDDLLYEIVDSWADRDGEKLAVTDGIHAWTYAELRDVSLRAAQVLLDLGVRPGDAVTVQAASSALIPALHFAVNRLGAVFVPVPEMWRAAEVEAVVRGSSASVLLVPGDGAFDHLSMARGIQQRVPQLVCVLALTGPDSVSERIAAARPDPARIRGFRPAPGRRALGDLQLRQHRPAQAVGIQQQQRPRERGPGRRRHRDASMTT